VVIKLAGEHESVPRGNIVIHGKRRSEAAASACVKPQILERSPFLMWSNGAGKKRGRKIPRQTYFKNEKFLHYIFLF
jgi:hypothetical protein